MLEYISVRGLRVTQLTSNEANYLFNLGNPLGFLFLDGQDIVYLGIFDLEPAKEVVFRLKLLLQTLHQQKHQFDTVLSKRMLPEQVENINAHWKRLGVEVVLSEEIDKDKVREKVEALTTSFHNKVPWKLLYHKDISSIIEIEYSKIGEI